MIQLLILYRQAILFMKLILIVTTVRLYSCILPDAYLCQHCRAVTVCTIFMLTKQYTNDAIKCVEQYSIFSMCADNSVTVAQIYKIGNVPS